MLPKCNVSVSFWQDVEKWIAKLSETKYNLSNNRIIADVLENNKAINQIHVILFGKVCFYPPGGGGGGGTQVQSGAAPALTYFAEEGVIF